MLRERNAKRSISKNQRPPQNARTIGVWTQKEQVSILFSQAQAETLDQKLDGMSEIPALGKPSFVTEQISINIQGFEVALAIIWVTMLPRYTCTDSLDKTYNPKPFFPMAFSILEKSRNTEIVSHGRCGREIERSRWLRPWSLRASCDSETNPENAPLRISCGHQSEELCDFRNGMVTSPLAAAVVIAVICDASFAPLGTPRVVWWPENDKIDSSGEVLKNAMGHISYVSIAHKNRIWCSRSPLRPPCLSANHQVKTSALAQPRLWLTETQSPAQISASRRKICGFHLHAEKCNLTLLWHPPRSAGSLPNKKRVKGFRAHWFVGGRNLAPRNPQMCSAVIWNLWIALSC